MESPTPITKVDHLPLGLLAENLRDANSRLCSWLDRLAANATHDVAPFPEPDAPTNGQSNAPVPVRPPVPAIAPPAPEQMAGLLSELARTGAWLRELERMNRPENDRRKSDPRKNDPRNESDGSDLERELARYRKNVERVRALLPAIHHALIEERARLEQERARVSSAAAWARGSRQTL